jgi:hypothetical protein
LAVAEQQQDPWSAFLDWLSTILIPDWGGLIDLLPVLLILGLVGPALSFLGLYWFYNIARSRRGKVGADEPEPVMATQLDDGTYSYPPNQPYCSTHHLIYPPQMRECPIDGEELLVRCPVDESVRVAGQALCRTCGTRYELGASLTPLVVRRKGRPPAGGAAVA